MGGVTFSWVVQGRLTDNGRTSSFFCETFICLYKIGKILPRNSVPNSSNRRNASLPTSDHTQLQSMTALWAPSPSRMAVHRLVANSRSLGARCVSPACSSDQAVASFVDDENDAECA